MGVLFSHEGQPYGVASALISERELILCAFGSYWFFGFSCCHLMPWENRASPAELRSSLIKHSTLVSVIFSVLL